MHIRNSLRAGLLSGALALMSALPSLAAPIFGPVSYHRTTGASDSYTDTFSAAAGNAVMAVVNGDDGGNRVTSGSIALNGVTLWSNSDFNNTRAFLGKAVTLLGGTNTLDVTLSSAPGSYITVVILPPGEYGDLSKGRLVLPWATASNLVLQLKNGAHGHGRDVRVVFYDAAGNAVASSARLHLDPQASLNQSASTLIANGSWTEGSVEVFYVGLGRGRLFGLAVSTDPATSVASIIPIQHAGFRRVGEN